MKTLNNTINIEQDMDAPVYTAQLDFIPEPPGTLNVMAQKYYTRICELLLKDGRMSHAMSMYACKLAEIVEVMSSTPRPDTRHITEYMRLSATLCYEIGFMQEEIQVAGVPILY